MIKKIYSAGIIPYLYGDYGREYLLLQYHAGYWDLPKGKLEVGETPREAAFRELFEETGIVDIELYDDFQETLSYTFYDQDRNRVEKTVYFFIGKAQSSSVTISHEHQGYVWLDYDQAMYRLTYKNARDVLTKAAAFLDEREAKNSE